MGQESKTVPVMVGDEGSVAGLRGSHGELVLSSISRGRNVYAGDDESMKEG